MKRVWTNSPAGEWILDKIAIIVSVALLLLVVSLLANGILDVLDWLDPQAVTGGEDAARDLVREHEGR